MKSAASLRGTILFFAFLAISLPNLLHAQLDPTLSVQGILKKANGVAVDDGTYSITFKLYTQETGGSAIWTETQGSVEVSSGIYSASLGTINPLTVAFDQLYYLGVTIGSTELTPRVLLTSAPYALSLIGQSNKFPSAGKVQADYIVVPPGAPSGGVANKGYSFATGGDQDGGMFSTADGQVGLYVNGAVRADLQTTQSIIYGTLITNDQTVNGTLTVNAGNLNIANNNSLKYNNVSDWRLVEVDFLENNAEGWQYSQDDADDRGAWKNGTSGACPVQDFGDYAGWVLRPAVNDYVVKKQFSPPGTYNYVKVVFKYFVIGNWDPGDTGSKAFAAFANNEFGSGIRLGWVLYQSQMTQSPVYDYDLFGSATSLVLPSNTSDHWVTGEMIGKRSSPFWVYFGYANNEGESDEHFAIGHIEVWVK